MTYKDGLKTMGKRIPARYIGEIEVVLSQHGGPYQDGNGLPLKERILRPGETLMMDEGEVNGHTIILDPRHEQEPVHVGVGRCVLPIHKDKSAAELERLGYQFHEGRRDFEAIVDAATASPAKREKEGNK